MLELQSIPIVKTAISHEGYIFEPANRIWKICREYSINLGWVDELLENELIESFLKVLAHYAQKYSASHTNNQCMRFQHFAKELAQSNGQRARAC